VASRAFEAADMRLALWGAKVGDDERVYLKGLLLKAAKRFEEAHKILGEGLTKTRQGNRLEPRFLHLIGTVAFKRLDHQNARAFLEAAQKVSPLNLRRRLMLAQLYAETGEPAKALAQFRAILSRVPYYPGSHARAVELLYSEAKQREDLVVLKQWLGFVPAGKLSALARKLDTNAAADLREFFASAVASTIMAHAQKATDADDHYAALNLYEKAEPLAKQGGAAILTELLLGRIETALALEDGELAASWVAELQRQSPTAPQLAALKARLERLQVRMKRASGG
jgi:Tfp pilus assembly protein PilF